MLAETSSWNTHNIYIFFNIVKKKLKQNRQKGVTLIYYKQET